jgi:hypothetical protein
MPKSSEIEGQKIMNDAPQPRLMIRLDGRGKEKEKKIELPGGRKKCLTIPVVYLSLVSP